MQLRMADSAYAAFVRLIDERTPGTLAVPGARWANRIAEMEQEAASSLANANAPPLGGASANARARPSRCAKCGVAHWGTWCPPLE